MNELKIIDERKVMEKDFKIYGTVEEPLFLAKDVANWIEYSESNVSKLVSLVDENEKVRSIITTLGGSQEAWFLTEDGLYEVLMQSRKPIAKAFKREVKEILKSIRKHGAYMTPQTLEKAILNPDTMIQLCTMLKEEQEKRRKVESENQKLAIENEDMKPKAEFYDTVTDSKDAISMAEVARVLDYDIGRNKLFELLKKKKILDKSRVPYQRFVDAGYFRVIETKYTKPNGDVCINIKTLVLQKGIDYIRKVLNEEGRKPKNKDGNRKEKHYESRD